MTPERREQAEKEVREKLGWWISGKARCFEHYEEKHAIDATRGEIDAYNLAVSQEIALAEAQERLQPFLDAVKREGDHLDADGLISAFIEEQERLRAGLAEAQERIAELEKALRDIRWFADERLSLEHCVAIYNTACRALRGTHQESTKGE